RHATLTPALRTLISAGSPYRLLKRIMVLLMEKPPSLHASAEIPREAECITPDNLAGKIAALPVQHGNAEVALGEFFTVEGDAGDSDVVLDGDCSRVKWLGAGMTTGRLTIRGNAGIHLSNF